MQFADGAPVAATIEFKSSEHGYSATSKTDAEGSFSLPILAGMKGELTRILAVMEQTLLACPELKVEPRIRGAFRFMNAAPVSLTVKSNRDDLKLEFPGPSCDALNRAAKKK